VVLPYEINQGRQNAKNASGIETTRKGKLWWIKTQDQERTDDKGKEIND